ncbi:CLUMA_CG018015, isoform A [Clunio marinus]|uniref:CLUMA_CG018015, isoform A n=1 Tax=Clunio marinus TaxID=568069 RepID=A0A1J1IZK4_9DIPT|nr:CLUMA_CG018015, isoform A [Clunio marinus]
MALLVFILFVITILVIWYQRKFYRKNALLAKIPAFKSYPVFGSRLALIGKSGSEIFETLQDASETLGPVWRLDLSPFSSSVFTSDVKMIESVLSSQKLLDKGSGYKFVRGWLQEAFHFNILQQFAEIMDHHGQICVSNLKKFDDQEIDFFSIISLNAFDVICGEFSVNYQSVDMIRNKVLFSGAESAMGCKINAQKNSESEYIKAVKEISNIIFLRTFNQFKRSDFLYQFTEMYQREQNALKVLHDFTDSVIVSRRKELESASHAVKNENDFGIKKRKAFLDLLLQSTIDGNPLTNSDIREEVDTFMFEGHDTTTSAICFTLYNLAKYPEIQEKVFEECKTTLGDDLQQLVTIHDLNNLHYLELTIKETLRLYPSVPFYGRNIKEDVTIGHLTIPKDTNVNVAAFFLGRNPDIFSDPLKFDPLRFDAETNNEKNNPYAYVPFSAGPRNCIGQKFAMLEMKSIVAKIIRNFKLSVTKENEKLELIAELVLRPVNGVKLRVQKRNND